MPVAAGEIVDGTVSGITKYGAFIKLKNGQVGLVHISEVSERYVKSIEDVLKPDQQVKVKVLSVDEENGKISLSIKKAQGEEKKAGSSPQGSTFEDKLTRFLKDSEERLLDLKRNFESKRGGGSPKR